MSKQTTRISLIAMAASLLIANTFAQQNDCSAAPTDASQGTTSASKTPKSTAASGANNGSAKPTNSLAKTTATKALPPKVATSKTAPLKVANVKSRSGPQKSTAVRTTATTTITRNQTKIPRPTGKAPATVTADGKPIWLDVKTARLASALKKKPIMVDFYTDWCHWCKVMDRTTFRDPKIEAYLAQHYVCMRVDAQDGADGEELAQRFGVTMFPTFMVIKSTGKPIARIEGYRDSRQFMETLLRVSKFLV